MTDPAKDNQWIDDQKRIVALEALVAGWRLECKEKDEEIERLRENLKSVCDNDLTLISLNSDLHTQIARLRGALELISVRGGNLPDDRLTSKTGPNDAVARGLMYVDCREIANDALSHKPEAQDNG